MWLWKQIFQTHILYFLDTEFSEVFVENVGSFDHYNSSPVVSIDVHARPTGYGASVVSS